MTRPRSKAERRMIRVVQTKGRRGFTVLRTAERPIRWRAR